MYRPSGKSMKAAVRHAYGPPDVIEIGNLGEPEPPEDGVLVKVGACGLNPYDYFVSLLGLPYIARIGAGLRRPKDIRLGIDFAGSVVAVGPAATGFEAGDRVYGFKSGALAEYVAVRHAVAHMPANLSIEEAAAVPTAGLTALQALRDKGRVAAGQRVLVNGAAGGVGTFTVQIAKHLGAEVTGVCSTANVDLVRSLGADRVVDYTSEEFTTGEIRYDVVIDNAGSRPWSEMRRVLAPGATWVMVGGAKDNHLLGPLGHWARVRIGSAFASQTAVPLLAKVNHADLDSLRHMIESGSVRPVIDRTYPLDEVAAALEYVGGGHARAKVLVTT